jgi:putative transposase
MKMGIPLTSVHQGTNPSEGIPMSAIVPKVRFSVKQRLLRHLRRCRDAGLRIRYLIIINLLNGRGAYETAAVLGIHNTTVYRLAKRFCQHQEAGLLDAREDNGAEKLSEAFLAKLDTIVRDSPQDYGWKRPTWTRELLVKTLVQETGVRIGLTTMSRALALIRARRGRPRPRVRCPWSKTAQTRRLNRIRTMLQTLPRGHVAVYEDEVDVHLNPKIGLDWMGLGQQKDVMTPGKNQKRYLAGAMDAKTRRVVWVEGERKTSDLFLDLLDKLVESYPQVKVIHVVLDNYRIHDSAIVKAALAGYLRGRIELHFLPPYSPDHNRIERVWQDLHANVTRNHTCPNMISLMGEVRYYLRKRNRKLMRIESINRSKSAAA